MLCSVRAHVLLLLLLRPPQRKKREEKRLFLPVRTYRLIKKVYRTYSTLNRHAKTHEIGDDDRLISTGQLQRYPLSLLVSILLSRRSRKLLP